jgi:4-amino-4-deoxy-L-arabinose transferase-like glycosyltransferase
VLVSAKSESRTTLLLQSSRKIPQSRYIPNVLSLIREHGRFFLAVILAGLVLRLFFFVYFPQITDDSRIYVNLATTWLQHGIYGQTPGGPPGQPIMPTDARLPGYPAFLLAIFWLFGAGNYKAVLLAQILFDLATCFFVADLARRMISDRAAQIAFLLAALCPFLANYAAAELTETLEVFFTALALDGAAAALKRMNAGKSARTLSAATGAAIAACILLRPDGGILLAAILLYLTFYAFVRRHDNARLLRISLITVALFALFPLVPWTIRNFRTLHRFQPLAPRYASDANELVARGFNRWAKTWIVDYVSVEEIYWSVSGDPIDASKLPSRAFDSPAQRDATLSAIAAYNESNDMTPEADARFANLAAERIRAHPWREYLVLPWLRIADMWLRPRTEILPPDPRWWEFNDDAKHSAVAVGFGLLNLAYVVAAGLALIPKRSRIHYVGLLVGFVLLRSAFLGTLENPEPRYTLECYPAIVVLASSMLAGGRSFRTKSQ